MAAINNVIQEYLCDKKDKDVLIIALLKTVLDMEFVLHESITKIHNEKINITADILFNKYIKDFTEASK